MPVHPSAIVGMEASQIPARLVVCATHNMHFDTPHSPSPVCDHDFANIHIKQVYRVARKSTALHAKANLFRPKVLENQRYYSATPFCAMESVPILCFAFVICVFALWNLRPSKKSQLPLPPGPKSLPILGNIRDLPKPGVPEWHHWAKHKELYGKLDCVFIFVQQLTY